ncbi:HlyD family type I secretion periplasmic adaptor subunit [Bradyrhizobium sp. U87765 SZCCT0131]|uniref:HlyD family type I secretion periplasmic adaptor subunit n=1 Tax=unclassified Bradyrhizobium TaxID=2631580 RepID=UPI001BA8A5AC|nr:MULTISPECIES: HlyD family type I secretion periplasmic adaptor subunit [unclassified Bradyrhizobium]MBR1219462.1 HlyD family type I secretion periplasmic adaptor subunit [Bradyrhizobium sp. U87765 SZCCT0131]MBR1262113.1 HlyD family type I secretion periplasmic adaptor subunit [Bradyrhizobium sp. U87765 SZCCT0134]MBR1306034.1 HlyD family type I secretion periplasmic adaptor subunit [Bradyrhizobium sp. U87765 SZCCT0110]MBR1317895.1 HlyD family type I secretion periplasmic adaptor subunit [Brad
MRSSDFAFANDIRAAVELRTPRTARLLLFSTLGLLFVFVVWAHFAVLDEVKRGNGKVVPSQQTQVVQTLEGGIIGAILVQEGALVDKDQPLFRIDDTNFAAQLGEVRERRAAMAARVARLEAEALGREQLDFPADLAAASPRSVQAERAVFEAHMRKLAQDVDVVAQQKAQKEKEIDELKASEVRFDDTLKLMSRELELTRNLYRQKVVPEIEMLRSDRQATDMRGQLAVVRASIIKTQAAIEEAAARMSTVRATFRAQAEDDLAKSRGDLAVLDENIKGAQDRVRRTELRAPLRGIVNKLNITTLGAVLQPGASIAELVPLDDTLLVESRIRPQDIAFMRPGQAAVVKITAYDSSVYGSLHGKVERISADTITDEKGDKNERGETFYRVMVRTERNHLGTSEHPLPIIPGMVTTVEILTGEKSVLDYIMKPARMLRDEALRER